MPIRIKSISVKDLGPIKNLEVKFDLFNLIYSKNERGKTFLTEFIIRSLFRNITRWSYLRKGGKGKVVVDGLENSSIEFYPASKKKLEDYWQEDEKGIPLSMAKLLVVRGGEAGIESDEEGISKFMIKEVLSGINILDKIDKDSNIPATIKKAEIESGQIIISRQGEGKKLDDAKQKLRKLEELFEKIESQYTQGILKTYKSEEKILKDRLELIKKAKRHLAYKTSEEVKRLAEILKEIPEDKLSEIEKDITRYTEKKNFYNDQKEKYNIALEKSKDFDWLEKATSVYKELLLEDTKKQGKLSPLMSTSGIISWVLFWVLISIFITFFISRNFSIYPINEMSILPLLFLIMLFCTTGVAIFLVLHFYAKKMHNYANQLLQNEELNKIRLDFKTRTGKELTSIVDLENELKNQGEYNSQAKTIRSELNAIELDLKKLSFQIEKDMLDITGEKVEEKDWDKKVEELKRKNRELKDMLDREREKLNKLNIPEIDYLTECVSEIYSPDKYEEVKLELENISKKIEEQEGKLTSLKYEICKETGDDPSIGWDALIESLQKKIWEAKEELREITSSIAAGIIVHNIVSELKEEEDIKIQKGLESSMVLNPLNEITKRYNKLFLEGEKLFVSDNYESFELKDLSTGAREQVMLALRIGFGSSLLRGDSLFLILDDAFQHSDWEKRKIIIDKLSDIAKNGWQIIYLTMDDHIKSLFNEVGRKFPEGQYVSIEL
ncbi:MAG: hypothetical protein H5T85_03585 [Actinobacteria bacterium]|nr:hypothetical protein [Actinomycetota bacterium]